MNKKIIFSLISLISGLALIFIFIMPFWSSINALKEEIIQRKLVITATEELLAKVQQLDQEYQSFEEQGQKVFFALPEEKDIPFLLVQFDTLAASNGLLLESISFGQIDRDEKGSEQGLDQSKKISSPFPNMSLNVKVSGSYGAFKGYLTSLENSVRSMDVHSIKFAIQKKGEEASILTSLGIFEFDLGVVVYYQ